MNFLSTEEGKNVFKECPLSEHPNPQFRRESYVSLNGWWDFCISDSSNYRDAPFNEKILVPFAVETTLSGIHRRVKQGEYLLYRKVFDMPTGLDPNHVALCFEAVDCSCQVYLNGYKVGFHIGGYTSFRFERLKLKKKNELIVIVEDKTDGRYPIGKQSAKPGGIWYHPTSGIWGSVWLENVPKDHIESIHYEIDRKALICRIFAKTKGERSKFVAEISFEGKLICKKPLPRNGALEVYLGKDVKEWDTDHPYLYDVKISGGDGGDVVYSYFGFREISKVEVHGHLYPALNGKPIFLTGPLDQGYYPESGLTPPSDQAMIDDIMKMKAYGFNVLRKHIKIEPNRWYYHCDRLGMLVMQDFMNVGAPYSSYLVNTGPFIRRHWDDRKFIVQKWLHGYPEDVQLIFQYCMEETINRLQDHPSIIVWTIFNEGWGQFETERMLKRVLELDQSRLIDANSGWIDQGVGDFYSNHIYFRKAKLKNDGKRILSLSEFGGYSVKVDGHTMMDKAFGYKKVPSCEALNAALEKLYKEEIIPLKKEGLAVAIYTQLSDVEEEINGLLTFDRAVAKADEALMRKINDALKEI